MSTAPKPPRPDFDAIKASADLVKVITSYGIELKKQGADFVGLCPFHEDTKPSLHVTPGKQLWHVRQRRLQNCRPMRLPPQNFAPPRAHHPRCILR